MKFIIRFQYLCLLMPFYLGTVYSQTFNVTGKNEPLFILYDKAAPKMDSIVANLLSEDIKGVTGKQAQVVTDISQVKGQVIVIGSIGTNLFNCFLNKQSSLYKNLNGKWECFGYKIMDQPTATIKKAFLIAGSDERGTAYGVFSLSEKIGVSPWYWWADVAVKKQPQLTLDQPEFVSSPPSVKYRGIFLNDEDWGLQPWAAKTFEPETGDIGPKTYAKIFELLLRLKGNLIWPAMHPSTKAFFHYPGNIKIAGDYQIVIGSSHAEPMLRNNVGEWDEKTMGNFNYFTNKERINQYWEERVKQSSGINAIYSMGMRGVHDSEMEGVKDMKEAVPVVEQIIKDERDMLARNINPDVTKVPQVLTPYKEVLEIYENGLKVPADITLIWPDDNYGYIQRLNNPTEAERPGGAGVYYHASYWGRPHDYLWLPSANPALMREEMLKAYKTGADKIWVLNVGDIKPLEYNTGMFMEMAYNIHPAENSLYVQRFTKQWAGSIFGKDNATAISSILLRYYQLAFERRPEFMGWSQVEPITSTGYTGYNHFYFGDEAQKRIDKYMALQKETGIIKSKMRAADQDAFYELVYYPVVAAAWMNKKFLYHDKAAWYTLQNRISAKDYAAWAKAAYDSIIRETIFFNDQLAGGKWKHMMSFHPRDLPVFNLPVFQEPKDIMDAGWGIAPEGWVTRDSSLIGDTSTTRLPSFNGNPGQQYFIDIFLTQEQTLKWSAISPASWIKLSETKGELSPGRGKNEKRIWVSIEPGKLPVTDNPFAEIRIVCGDQTKSVGVNVHSNKDPGLKTFHGFIEENGYVNIQAENFSRKVMGSKYNWEMLYDIGYTGNALQAGPIYVNDSTASIDSVLLKTNNGAVEYDFYNSSAGNAMVTVFTLPTHPVNNQHSMRFAVSVDNGPLSIPDFKTFGRSEEWKQNVLTNRAGNKIEVPNMNPGKHILKIYSVDPGVILDEIRINWTVIPKAYSALPETK